tara:strand:+ start:1108 stop:2877 length:1770 start_codon:yes stop_codon:yes gene_type:complete
VKVCLGQINTTPGDFEGNFSRIRAGIESASHQNAHMVVFPELSIPGYLSQDLMYHPTYIDENLSYLNEITQYASNLSPNLYVIVGYIDRSSKVGGKPFANMAAVIHQGEVIARYQKQLLPFYDVFDELRYFEPGTDLSVLDIQGRKVGIAICEDLWNDKGSDDYNYTNNPLRQYRDIGVDTIVSLNSSPYIQGKPWQRLKVMGPSSKPDVDIIYVNQRGGQDELVFDGHSFVLSNDDLIHVTNEPFEDSCPMIDLSSSGKPLLADIHEDRNRELVESYTSSLFDMLVLCLRDFVKKQGFTEVVLASSGGVDSALVSVLACQAVGAKNVHTLRLPSVYSSQHSKDDALQLHTNLGCWDYEVPIDHIPLVAELNDRFSAHVSDADNLVTRKVESNQYADVADENIQARLRDVYVMHFANAYGALPLSTGNKTESACGYYTHFDMNFAFAPIKDLYKFQVVDLVRSNPLVPENIWKKPPSAELSRGQTDEESLLPYAYLDPIVKSHIEDYISTFKAFRHWLDEKSAIVEPVTADAEALQAWLDTKAAETDYDRIVKLIGRMEFKRRQTCPGTKTSKVAFGIGRRIPIVGKWR